MTELLANHVAGRWQTGQGPGSTLLDPVLGTPLVRVDATGLDLPAAFAFARDTGGKALRALNHAQRAKLLADVAAVLLANRDAYYEISIANSGTVKNDTGPAPPDCKRASVVIPCSPNAVLHGNR